MCLNDNAMAAPPSTVDDRLERWRAGFEYMFALVAGRFAQVESRRRARMYVLGLLSGAERKNSWTIAEAAGDLTPDGMQRLLNFYSWDADAVRDDLRGYVLDALSDPSGVMVADETGFLKKGTKSAGVQRQYSGTAGRIENCQLGVFLTYASSKDRALIDRELYLPASWTANRDRCREAGIGEEAEFATKPELAARMLARARDAGAVFGWFTADEAYGDNPGLRAYLEDQDINYVMAISCDQRFPTPTGRIRADELAAQAPQRGWQRLSAGAGSKGQRLYDWLLLDPGTHTHPPTAGPPLHQHTNRAGLLHRPHQHPGPAGRTGPGRRIPLGRGGNLPIHQKRDRTGPLPGSQIPRLVPPHHPIHARRRLPHHHRPHRASPRRKRGNATDHEPLIPLSCNEIRRLWATCTRPSHPRPHTDHWSHWRRHHQTHARACHYQRQHLKHHKMRL
jgi:DDE superfamily endonuclease